MNIPELSDETRLIVSVALRMVAESREFMNTCTDEIREELEREARLIIEGDGCPTASHAHKA